MYKYIWLFGTPQEKQSLLPAWIPYVGGLTRRALSDEIRRAVVEILLLCAPYRASRQILKSSNVYFIVREQHKYEEAKKNSDIAEKIERKNLREI